METGLKNHRDQRELEWQKIAGDEEQITKQNFSSLKRQLITPMEYLKTKNSLILNTANAFDSLFPDVISQTQIRTLQSNPQEFKIPKARGNSQIKGVESNLVEAAYRSNFLQMNYKVSLLLLDFLVDEYNFVKKDWVNMRDRYLEEKEKAEKLAVELEKLKTDKQLVDLDEVDSELYIAPEEIDEYLEHEESYETPTVNDDYLEEDEPKKEKKKSSIVRDLKQKLNSKQNIEEEKEPIVKDPDFDDIEKEFERMEENKKR
jgi:hypothetical protein